MTQAGKPELEALKREAVGRSLNTLRKEGFLPSVLYGHGFEPVSIQIKYSDFEKVYRSAGESTLINLKLGDKSELAMIKDVQRDSLTEKFLHADFYRVRMEEKIKAAIPLVFEGDSEAVKAGGILVKPTNEVEIESLPQDLPHELRVDITPLKEFGDEILMKDVPVPPGVKVFANPEDVVALIQAPREEVEEELPAPAPEEVEVIKKEEKPEEEIEEKKEEKGTPPL